MLSTQSRANADEFPAASVAPVIQYRAANRALLRVFAIGIQERVVAEYWNFADQGVAAIVRVDELAGHDSGLTVIHEPDNFDRKFCEIGGPLFHSTYD